MGGLQQPAPGWVGAGCLPARVTRCPVATRKKGVCVAASMEQQVVCAQHSLVSQHPAVPTTRGTTHLAPRPAGNGLFEKQISGLYLGEVARRILLRQGRRAQWARLTLPHTPLLTSASAPAGLIAAAHHCPVLRAACPPGLLSDTCMPVPLPRARASLGAPPAAAAGWRRRRACLVARWACWASTL